jgi:hypothetical protein
MIRKTKAGPVRLLQSLKPEGDPEPRAGTLRG